MPPPPHEPVPAPDDGPMVGWYPSGQPAAGPFAKPATPGRRAIPGLSRFGKPAGSAGWTRAWNGRGTMMNVLLFGVGPLALAGIIVAAFVLVTPGQGSASSLGFKAGPAPSTQQLTASAMATPSQSPSAHKKHPRATSTASLPAKTPDRLTSQSAAPKPANQVTPHNLGRPNFAGYCQHIGHHTPRWWPATPTAGAARCSRAW